MVTLPGDVIRRYERFSLYNSPYPSHDRGRAVDLYPGHDDAVSPVAGEVLDARTVRCPPREYAVDHDHLVLVDVDERSSALRTASGTGDGRVARILHVDPAVEPGDEVAVGDSLGTLVRSGFFGQWVDNHLHVGFRDRDADLYRASGSLPLDLDVTVAPLSWDGTGTVVDTGPTYALLDAPANDTAGFAALASDEGVPLDGGLVHYSGGGTFGDGHDGTVSLLGCEVGVADGGDVTWNDVAVLANEAGGVPREASPGERAGTARGSVRAATGGGPERATGLSLFASRVDFGAKLVFHEGHDFAVGDRVTVTVRESDDPIQLG